MHAFYEQLAGEKLSCTLIHSVSSFSLSLSLALYSTLFFSFVIEEKRSEKFKPHSKSLVAKMVQNAPQFYHTSKQSELSYGRKTICCYAMYRFMFDYRFRVGHTLEKNLVNARCAPMVQWIENNKIMWFSLQKLPSILPRQYAFPLFG